MYGRSRPDRPCASCTVATPSLPSVSITAASARGMFRTMVGFIESMPNAQCSMINAEWSESTLGAQRALGFGQRKSVVEARVDPARVGFEDLLAVAIRDRRGVDVS